jgi:hypothetical protein
MSGMARQMNESMRRLLTDAAPGVVPAQLSTALEAGLADVDGCLLLESQRELVHASLEQFQDRTGYEAFVNHLHLDVEGADPRESARAGLAAVMELSELVEAFPDAGPVQVVLSVDLDDPRSITVRFHRRRAGEAWLSADLEGFLTEAILVESIG